MFFANFEFRSFLKIVSWDDPARIVHCKPLMSMLWGFCDVSLEVSFLVTKAISQRKDVQSGDEDTCDYAKFNVVKFDIMVTSTSEVARELTEQDLQEFRSLTMMDLLNLCDSNSFRSFVARSNKVLNRCPHKHRVSLVA